MTTISTVHAEHLGHQHGAFGELIEGLIQKLGLSENITDFIAHFLIDTINVLILLLVVMTVVYFFTSFLNTERLHKRLASLNSLWGYGLAIVIGVLSPFCSCSTIPILMGFLSMGVPVSVCLCYLTASSMLNLTALVSLFAISGWQFLLAYIVCSLIIIAASSLIIRLLKLDGEIKHYHIHDHHAHDGCETIFGRLKNAFRDTLEILKKSALWVIIGVAVSSAIMAFISLDRLRDILQSQSALSTTAAVLIGVPIHSDIFSIATLIKLLISLSPSLALTFTFSTMALSLPSVIILTRALKTKTVLIYCGVILALALALGYICVLII